MYKVIAISGLLTSNVCLAQYNGNALGQLSNQQQNSIQQQNQQSITRSAGNIPQQHTELKAAITESKISADKKKASVSKYRFTDVNSPEYKTNSNNYIAAYNELNSMLSTDTALSVKRGVYIVENAYLEKKLSYDKFLKLIQQKVNLVKYILKKEKLDANNPDAVHYAIQKLYAETLYIKQPDGTTKMIKPLYYDFNDPFRADEQLVTKLLLSNKGQCHSLPLLYMILAEEFNIKAYVAYSPQHSFIKFQTKKGAWFNFETTNGRLTSDAFVLGSGFIKSEALKSNIFNEAQSPKEVIANMFIDLANNYQEQFGYDEFQQKCVDKNIQFNPNYIYAKVVQANYQTALTDLALAQENYPNPKYLSRYPYITKMMQKRDEDYDELDNVGFTSMPKEAYQGWLKSLKQGQEKQNSEELNSKFINQIKN